MKPKNSLIVDLNKFVVINEDERADNLGLIAAKMWVSTRTIRRWVSGETSPNRVEAIRLRRILNGYKFSKKLK